MRDEQQIRERLTDLILGMAPTAEGAGGKPDPRLVDDLGFNSLRLMELVFAVEDQFDLQIPDDGSLADILSLNNALDYIVMLLERQDAETPTVD